jgi:glycine cleavage system H protein
MVVLLVIVTFAIFIAIDMLLSRYRVPVVPTVTESVTSAAHAGETILNGFHVPANLRYHAGHTWLLRERKGVHRVGADELAAIVAGPVDRIELPQVGQWIRQGQKVFSFFRGGEKVEMLSPVEGEVIEVNRKLEAEPALLREDPYGQGWMVNVFSPDEDSPSRNLLPANLLKSWMRDAADSFYRMQPQLAGVTAADGGRPLKDATANLTPEQWKKAASELFLS